MILNEGKIHIKRVLAGFEPLVAQTMAFGVGTQAENVNQNALQFEATSSQINLTSYDFSSDNLVFKAALPDDFIGTINEIGLYSNIKSDTGMDFGSRMITSFDSETEDWLDSSELPATYTNQNARMGIDALRLTAAASATTYNTLALLGQNFDVNSNDDTFALAYNCSSNVSAVTVRFSNDAANYFEITFPGTSGYNIARASKGSATATGNPRWDNIQSLRVAVTAGAGTATVDFDGLRIDEAVTQGEDYVLVARKVLPAPIVKIPGQANDVEFYLSVNV